ncbi:serine/threonine-protein kinase [Actinomadura craniellae]|uniref:serine/threonine-protein kinase n=1 Tax=Actinomadura craniellae TaxID=2231787 RepID=UPI00131480D8|nr:serine/threonine-protein kinase [Actinomadura craniellae]
MRQQRQIGPYRQLARLGEGGMGVVYRGADPAGRDVAIKVLKPEVAREPTALRRLAREVDMMRRVLSPHVADVLDGDVTADHPYIVTRFVPGRPLDEVVAEHGPLTGPALRRLAIGLAKALTAIHEAGIVHRDLKPSNVLLVDGEPVVIDFGIAQAIDSTRLTQTGMLTGTPGYLAPEILDDERATSASDVHAWAVTVAFAATGLPPFGQGAMEAVFLRILNGRAQLDGVPEPLLPLLRSAMSRDPAARPTAAELIEAATALDLGPAEVTVPDAPAPDAPAPDIQATAIVPPPAEPARPVSAAPPTRIAGPGEGLPGPSRLAVAPTWTRLLSAMVVTTAVGVTIMMPVVGVVLSLGAVFALRAGAALPVSPGALVHALGRTAATVPYAAVVTLVVTVLLAALVAVGAATDPVGACAWGTGAGVYVLWAGPGVRGPARGLRRLLGGAAASPRRIGLVGVAFGTLAFLSVVGAVSLTPSLAPMYGLQNSLDSSLTRFQEAVG